MIIIPKESFSNFLETKDFNSKSRDYDISKEHANYLSDAQRCVNKDTELQELLRFYGISSEDTSYVIKNQYEEFYYLRYNKNAFISIVFDQYAADILEVLVNTNLSLKRKKKEKRESENPDSRYIEILKNFSAKLRQKPSIKEMIEHSNSNDIYFIDTYESMLSYKRVAARNLLDTLKEFDTKCCGFVYEKREDMLFLFMKSSECEQGEIETKKYKNCENSIQVEQMERCVKILQIVNCDIKNAVMVKNIDTDNDQSRIDAVITAANIYLAML